MYFIYRIRVSRTECYRVARTDVIDRDILKLCSDAICSKQDLRSKTWLDLEEIRLLARLPRTIIPNQFKIRSKFHMKSILHLSLKWTLDMGVIYKLVTLSTKGIYLKIYRELFRGSCNTGWHFSIKVQLLITKLSRRS